MTCTILLPGLDWIQSLPRHSCQAKRAIQTEIAGNNTTPMKWTRAHQMMMMMTTMMTSTAFLAEGAAE
jgi:hypothetical protein